MTILMGYLDIDVLITKSGETHHLSLSSSAGDRHDPIDLSLAALQAEMTALATLTHSSDPTAYDRAAAWGQALYKAVFHHAERLMGNLHGRADANKQGVRFRIRSNDPDVHALAWEYLHDGKDFFAFDPRTAIVRYPHVEQPRPTLVAAPDELPLRLLVVLANPHDADNLNVEEEWQRLSAVLEPMEEAGLIEVEVLPHATIAQMRDALLSATRRFTMLHFVGHGQFDPITNRGTLLLEDEKGGRVPLSDRTLALWVKQSGRLRAVFLNACESGNGTVTNQAVGLAQHLMTSGVGAVVAHQFPIRDRIGIAFAQDFYNQITEGHSIEAAITMARSAIGDIENIAWGTPVLFLRADDGRLIDHKKLTPDLRNTLQAAGLRRSIAKALDAREWVRVMPLLKRLTELIPDDTTAKEQYEQFRRANGILSQVEQHLVQQNITAARNALAGMRLLAQVQALNYRDWEAKQQEIERIFALQTHNASAQSTLPKVSSKNQRDLNTLITLLLEHQLVPFLGGNVNRAGRDGKIWKNLTDAFAPTSQEIADYLLNTKKFEYPQEMGRTNLARVSQYMVWERSADDLTQELHKIFETSHDPTPLHHLLAAIAGRLAKQQSDKHFILISSNYDRVLEATLSDNGVAFHLLTYAPELSGGGRFYYTSADKSMNHVLVETANKIDVPKDGLPVIIKINGALLTDNPNGGLVTEEHFIDLLPHEIRAQLSKSHFLFLGYSLRDWQLRLMVRRMGKRNHSWAVLEEADSMALIPWDKVALTLIRQLDMNLDETIAALDDELRTRGDL